MRRGKSVVAFALRRKKKEEKKKTAINSLEERKKNYLRVLPQR